MHPLRTTILPGKTYTIFLQKRTLLETSFHHFCKAFSLDLFV